MSTLLSGMSVGRNVLGNCGDIVRVTHPSILHFYTHPRRYRLYGNSGDHLCRGQQRPRADFRCSGGITPPAHRSRAPGCTITNPREQAGLAARALSKRTHGPSRSAWTSRQTMVYPGELCAIRGWFIRRYVILHILSCQPHPAEIRIRMAQQSP